MKVLIIGSLPSSLTNFRKELIVEIKKRNHNLLTCAGELDLETMHELKLLNVKYSFYKIKRHSVSLFHNIITFYQIFKIINKFRPDVVIPYTIKPVIFASLISKLLKFNNYPMITGLGYVFLSKNIWINFLLKRFVIFLYKFALSNSKKIFFQNSDDIKYFISNKIISKNTYTVNTMGSGVNLNHFNYSKMNLEKFSFLMISRLLPEKGVIEYLHVVKKLNNKYDNMHFALLGNFENGHPKNDLISKLIKESRVEYVKYKKDIRPYINKSNVIVLPSYREGMPRSVLEGMSMGRAIITTDVPGCKETVINGYNGYLIKHANIFDLEKAILKICDFKKIENMGKNSRAIVKKKFDVKYVNDLIISEIGL